MKHIPKDFLVRIIIKNIDATKIRDHFSIKDETDLVLRLNSFSIAELDEFIRSQNADFVKLIDDYSDDFPLRSAPTLFILDITKSITPKFLEERSIILASRLREEALIFPSTRAVRAIYTRRPIRFLEVQRVYELVLGYEKRIEFVESDPHSQNYAETRIEYSLENALLWYPKDSSSYAVVACCDFAAISSLILYLNQKYNLESNIPDFTEAMLSNLAIGSKVRNATFSLELNSENENDIDVNSITVYDKNLSETKIYKKMRGQKGRTQRSGFFVNHPNLLRAGVGISCKYGRLWTPAHLDRSELISLATGSIQKLDVKLNQVAENELEDFFSYYANKEVKINSSKITGTPRKLFDRLVYYLVNSQRSNNGESNISLEFQKQLSLNYKKLRFELYVVDYCKNCGKIEIHCPKCDKPASIRFETESPSIICSSCNEIIDLSSVHCDCGESIQILNVYSSIEYLPTPELLDAISKYSDSLHPKIVFPSLFKIEGALLHTLPPKNNASARIIHLSDLKFWNIRAHYTSINSITNRAKKYVTKAYEKCNINDYHPTEVDCIACAKKNINELDFETNSICLLRTFGIPIQVIFDGIHHGHEFADIVYTDEYDDKQHEIAIHVKRHNDHTPKNGLGRSNSKIKGLYAQVFYTLFDLQKQRENVDTIGIAIPNRISDDVINSMQAIVLRMGYSFMALQKDDWEKITQAAIETVQFQ